MKLKVIITAAIPLMLTCCSSEIEDKNIYIEFSHSLDSLEAPATVHFYNYTVGAINYQWNFGDSSSISDEFEPSHFYEQPGDYEVTLTAFSNLESKSLIKTLPISDTIPGNPVVTAPPAELGLNPFYTKYIDANGIPVVSSGLVPDQALIKVMVTANRMLEKIPEVRNKMIQFHARIGIMSKDEVTTDIPEHAYLANDTITNWDTRARGLGGTVSVPITTCAEENVLCYQSDWYSEEDIFIHEFAHAIHLMGIQYVEPDFNNRLNQALFNAKAEGKWVNTYAVTNNQEYWSEGVQCWFNVNNESASGLPDGIHNHVNTREELKEYDLQLYELISNYFEEKNIGSCHEYVSK